jgi:hypothetical protein
MKTQRTKARLITAGVSVVAIGMFRMVAYNFFTTVDRGEQTVEAMYASCCSSERLGSGAAVESPVLKPEYTSE